MKLYIYDHCPFCVRARMIFGICNQPIQLAYFDNDDEANPIALIGAKQVPILQKDDGSHMAESLDIVRYINIFAGELPIKETVRPEISAWMEANSLLMNRLTMPRMIKLRLPEFPTQSAIDYYTNKKTQTIGNFTENLAKSSEYIAQLENELAKLENWLPENSAYLNGIDLSFEDFYLFPLLRNLSMVKGLTYPPKLLAYTQKMAQKSKVNTYFDRAL